MNILVAASEMVPFCKTGGLADVAGALSQSVARLGHGVCLFLPSYRAIEGGSFPLKAVPGRYWVPIGHELVPATLSTASWGAVTVYFIQCPKYFAREGLYQAGGKDYDDNDERFIFFCRAVLEGAKFVGFKPDVVHCHDWQTALIPAYLKTLYQIDAFYAKAKSLLTIHNIAYQGMFSKDALFLAGFGWVDFTPDRLEYYGGFNFLKAGLVFADALTTVSPTYAQEIQSSPEFGRGMEGILKHRRAELRGILNGIDVEIWNPETDQFLARAYDADGAPAGKAANKAALRAECGLKGKPNVPLIGVVSRLDSQKGLDVALEVVADILARGGAELILLGAGDPALAQAYAQLVRDHPGAACTRNGFDEALSHRIYAAADLFLMPSRFEPCGLGQMIAMRYGTLPVVTRTGGLADTVREDSPPGPPNGFVAPKCAREDLAAAMTRALSVCARLPERKARVAAAMSQDFSWRQSAARYADLYRAMAGASS
ncbi:MAG: glycogen synthase GlgA [Elusimicrobia bacterium]|nr:glycogen synthase GlgA [Elusimicrobiota bacterium]